jgi:hypothetical protein
MKNERLFRGELYYESIELRIMGISLLRHKWSIIIRFRSLTWYLPRCKLYCDPHVVDPWFT